MNKLFDAITPGLFVAFLLALFIRSQSDHERKSTGSYVFVSYVIKRKEEVFVCDETKFLSTGFNQHALWILRNELKHEHSITNDPDLTILNLTRLETK